MVGTSANIGGVLLGFLVPGLFVKAGTQEEIRDMLVAVAVFGSVAALMILVFFRERPPTEPPRIEQEVSTMTLTTFGQFKVCMCNANFMLAMISSSLQITFFYVFATVLGQLIAAFGYVSSDFVAMLGILLNAFGILGAFLASLLFKGAGVKRFKIGSMVINGLTLLAFGYFMVAAKFLND